MSKPPECVRFFFIFFLFAVLQPRNRTNDFHKSGRLEATRIVHSVRCVLIKVTNRFQLQLLNSCVGYLLTARTLIILFFEFECPPWYSISLRYKLRVTRGKEKTGTKKGTHFCVSISFEGNKIKRRTRWYSNRIFEGRINIGWNDTLHKAMYNICYGFYDWGWQ